MVLSDGVEIVIVVVTAPDYSAQNYHTLSGVAANWLGKLSWIHKAAITRSSLFFRGIENVASRLLRTGLKYNQSIDQAD